MSSHYINLRLKRNKSICRKCGWRKSMLSLRKMCTAVAISNSIFRKLRSKHTESLKNWTKWKTRWTSQTITSLTIATGKLVWINLTWTNKFIASNNLAEIDFRCPVCQTKAQYYQAIQTLWTQNLTLRFTNLPFTTSTIGNNQVKIKGPNLLKTSNVALNSASSIQSLWSTKTSPRTRRLKIRWWPNFAKVSKILFCPIWKSGVYL